ncbi:MAG: 3-isopropylmalate dehydrogenase [Cyanobacteriota bacterium]
MTKEFKIALLPGDGIGPDVVNEAVNVLNAIEKISNIKFVYEKLLVGGASIEEYGLPITQETLEKVTKVDAVFLGAIGDFTYDTLDPAIRPEVALLKLRQVLGNFTNLRPTKVYEELIDNSPLKPERIKNVDIMIVRELVGGIYFGDPKGRVEDPDGLRAFNTMVYTAKEIRRIAKIAFEIAKGRNNKLCSVDKANVLAVSQLWRDVVIDVSKDYPEVELSHLYVDNAAMQLVLDPQRFDTIVTGNMFGDILSDEAAILTGSIGMLPSACLGGEGPAMYEPVHGSAPDLVGQDTVNPIAAILSAAMMLKYSFNLHNEYTLIDNAVKSVLKEGYRTKDIAINKDVKVVGTKEMGKLITNKVLETANVKC